MGGCSLVSTRLQPPILLYHRPHQLGECQFLVCHNLMFFLNQYLYLFKMLIEEFLPNPQYRYGANDAENEVDTLRPQKEG